MVDALSAIGEKSRHCPANLHLALSLGSRVELPVADTPSGSNGRYQPSLYGDFHAIGIANNLLAALIDNHIHHGNELGIDSRRITWKRVVDMNDRQLRHIVDGLQGKTNGVPREDGFDITVASEIMAILCLSENILDLKNVLIASLSGTTTKDNRSQPKTSRLEGPWQLSSKMPSIQIWYKP